MHRDAAILIAMSHAADGRKGRILQLGPLHSVHLARWAEIAAELGWRVVVAGHQRTPMPLAPLSAEIEEIRVAPESSTSDPTLGAGWLRGTLLELRPDLVHAHWLPGWAAVAVLADSRPLVVSLWGSDVYLSAGDERRRGELALRGADRVLAPSAHLSRELFARGLPAERCDVVDLGVDLAAFRPAAPGEAAAARARLGLGRGPVVLSFRAAQPLYRLPLVLAAFRRFREGHRDAELVIAHGPRPPHPDVAGELARAQEDPAVHVVGDVAPTEMALFFQLADVGISLPWSDAAARSVGECLACGTPVVAADIAQVRERYADAPAVRLVEPDAERVADALAAVLAQRHSERLAAAARAWAESNVDYRVGRRRLGEVYDELLRATISRADSR